MPGNIIDALYMVLGIDTSGMDEGIRQAENKLRRGLSSLIRNFAAPLTAAMSFRAALNAYTNDAARFGQAAEQIGVSSEALQAWGGAVERVGGSAQALQGTIAGLTRRITNLTKLGGAEGAEAFRRYGISIRDANGNIKDSSQILQDLAGLSERMDRKTFTAVASQFGIDQGTINLLAKGRGEVDRLIQRQKELGLYTQQDYEIAQKYKVALADLSQAFKGVAAVVMRIITPALSWLTEQVTTFFTFLRRHEGLIQGLGIGAAIVLTSKLIPAFKLLSSTVMSLPLLKTLGQWAAMITFIGLIVEDFLTYLKGGKSALEGFWSSIGTPEEIKAAWESFRETLGKFGDVLEKVFSNSDLALGAVGGLLLIWKTANLVLKVLPLIKSAFTGIAVAAKAAGAVMTGLSAPVVAAIAAVSAALFLLWKYWDEVKAAAGAAWDWTKAKWGQASEFFRNLGNSLKEGLVQGWEDLKAALSSWGEQLKGWVSDLGSYIKNAFKDAFQSMFDWIPSWSDIKAKMFGGDTKDLPKTPQGTVDVSQTPIGQRLAAAGDMGFPMPGGAPITSTQSYIKDHLAMAADMGYLSPNPGIAYGVDAVSHGGSMAGPAGSVSTTNSVRQDNDVNIGNIYVNAPEAKDANGIAANINTAMRNNPMLGDTLVFNMQSGVNQK